VPAYLDWGGTLRPIFGGSLQKLNRLGDRFALSVTMPPLPTADAGRIWVASLILAQRQGAIMRFYQPGFDPGEPGSPVVDGAGQAGSSLALRGFVPGYVVRFGQFFSMIVGGRYYIEMAAADATADSDGKMVLPISPMMRMRPSSGTICDFVNPKIEGLLDGERREWTLDVALFTGLTFQIEEAK
jgi:hypothetical protein